MGMGIGIFLVVVAAAVLFGIAVQLWFQPKTNYEWLIAGIGAGLGAYLASEITWTQWFTGLTDLGPEVDGLLIVPAVIGGLLLGAIFELGARIVEQPTTA